MRPIHAPKKRGERRYRRHLRVRQRVAGTIERPRLVVFRSLKHIYAQLVNDDLGTALLGVSGLLLRLVALRLVDLRLVDLRLCASHRAAARPSVVPPGADHPVPYSASTAG